MFRKMQNERLDLPENITLVKQILKKGPKSSEQLDSSKLAEKPIAISEPTT